MIDLYYNNLFVFSQLFFKNMTCNKREKETDRQSLYRERSNKFDQDFHVLSRGSCLAFPVQCIYQLNTWDLMKDINLFRRIIKSEHLIMDILIYLHFDAKIQQYESFFSQDPSITFFSNKYNMLRIIQIRKVTKSSIRASTIAQTHIIFKSFTETSI